MATTRFADHILSGTTAARPAATAVPVGTIYASSTDGTVYQSDGASWGTWLASAAAGAGSTDGWVNDTAETWTYATGSGGGAATFTVPTDLTSKYTKGTRIKLTQTTVKYFVVVAVSYSAPNTTVTITAGSDYTLANAAISANYHSYVANPQGWPGWFNFAGAATGFSSKTTEMYRFAVNGRVAYIECQVNGTSNATTLTMTAPIACATQPNGSARVFGPVIVVDNDTSLTTPGRAFIASASTTITINKDFGGATTFQASAGKAANFSGFYEI